MTNINIFTKHHLLFSVVLENKDVALVAAVMVNVFLVSVKTVKSLYNFNLSSVRSIFEFV